MPSILVDLYFLLLVLLYTSNSLFASEQQKKLLAVLEFEVGWHRHSRGPALTLVDPASDAARNYLSRDHYKIITRESFERHLRDNEIDPNCVEGVCEVDTAKNIGADFFISGQVINIDNRYILTLKLFETENGEFFVCKRLRP